MNCCFNHNLPLIPLMDILDHRGWPERLLSALDERDSPWSLFLEPPSWIYRGVSWADRALRTRSPLSEPPLSVGIGNLRVGGTGKTPLVSWLCQKLHERGLRCAILSRGYRSAGGGDEPEWLRKETGALVVLDSDRRRAHAQAAREGAQIVILDDSLQSRVCASLQVAVLLAADLMSPPRVLPAGAAREPMSGLRRCQMIMVRRENGDPVRERLVEVAQQYCPRVYVFRLAPEKLLGPEGEQAPLSALEPMGPCVLLSGLARPESFEEDAKRVGAQAVVALRYSDHASFDSGRAEEIEKMARQRQARFLLCPEKNFARLVALGLGLPLWALCSRVKWEGEDPLPEFLRAIQERVGGESQSSGASGESASGS